MYICFMYIIKSKNFTLSERGSVYKSKAKITTHFEYTQVEYKNNFQYLETIKYK